MSCRLSILTTCHNVCPFFRPMLESFLNSGYHFRDTEIVVRDNASPVGGDGDLARIFAKRYPDIVRVSRNEVNCGIHRASQQGYEDARGEYIMTFGYDDIFSLFDIDAELDFLDSHHEYCATAGKKWVFDSEKGNLGVTFGSKTSYFALAIEPRETDCGMIIRRSDLMDSGGCFPFCIPDPPEVMPDVVTHIGLLMRKPILWRDQLRGFYRSHPNQHTKLHQQDYSSGYDKLRDCLTGYYHDLYDILVERKPSHITPDKFRVMTMLLGILYYRGNFSVKTGFEYLNLAERFSPDDYGILEFRVRLYQQLGDYPAALSELFRMSRLHEGDDYVQQMALMMAIDIMKQGKMHGVEEMLKARERVCARFFYLSAVQQSLLNRVIDESRNL